MRIAYDARMIFGNFSGIGHYSLKLLQALAELDRNREYVVIVREGFKPNLPENFRILEYNYSPLSFSTLYRLKRKLGGIDIFHSPFQVCPLNLECQTLVTAHDLMPLLMPDFFKGRNFLVQLYAKKFIRFALSRSFEQSGTIISDSQNTKEDIMNLSLGSERRIRVVYPSVSLDLLQSKETNCGSDGRYDGKPVILTVGQTRPQKNWWRLIKAFKIFGEQVGQGVLILVSSDDRNLKSINSLIRELAFESDEVKVLGYQTQEELVRLYRSADLFVFPSLYEGFGLPPLEAMACGVPVVASNRGSLPEVLGNAAYYVDPEDEKDIARGMQTVLENSNLQQELIQKGYQQVQKYSWERTARQILDLYNEVYQERKR